MSALITRAPDPNGEDVQILGVFRASSLNAYDPELDARPVEVSLSFHNETPSYFLVSITYLRDKTHNRQACEAMGKCWGFQSLEEAQQRYHELHDLVDEIWLERFQRHAEDQRAAEQAEDEEFSAENVEATTEGMFRPTRAETEPRRVLRYVYYREKAAPPSASDAESSITKQNLRSAPKSARSQPASPVCVANAISALPDCDPSYSFFSFGN